ncbi:MAG: 30S ribosomal protein S6 [Parcubacteria group bacterium]|jgi:ribosomal protein S6|nr:30S ribosomal protein S6 [Candidatus Moranbacteria bacterium]
MEYEVCYLIGETKEANLEKIRKEVEEVIEKNKGKLLEGEFVKKRRLAYEIKNESRGTYVAKRFVLPSRDERDEKYKGENLVGKITKEVGFNQDILRFIIVKADEIPSLKELEKSEKGAREENRDLKKELAAKKFAKEKKSLTEDKEKVFSKDKKESGTKEKVEKVVSESPKIEEKKGKKEEKSDISEDNIDEKLDEILNI